MEPPETHEPEESETLAAETSESDSSQTLPLKPQEPEESQTLAPETQEPGGLEEECALDPMSQRLLELLPPPEQLRALRLLHCDQLEKA